MNVFFKSSRSLKTILAAGSAVATLTAAHADLTLTQTTSLDMSKITIGGQPITDQEMTMLKRLPMFQSAGLPMTTYVKDTKVRTEAKGGAIPTMITDSVAKTITTIDDTSKTYYVQSLSVGQTDKMMGKMKVEVKDLNDTQTVLGHTCHGYEMVMTGPQMTFDAVMYTATDLPSMPTGMSLGNPQLDSLRDKIKGMPLKMDGTMTSPSFGVATMKFTVTSLSEVPVADSLFTPPADYKKTDKPAMPAGFGGMGQ